MLKKIDRIDRKNRKDRICRKLFMLTLTQLNPSKLVGFIFL